MPISKEASERLFKNIWVCMKCNARNRGNTGERPLKCRKCGSKRLRQKKKPKKA